VSDAGAELGSMDRTGDDDGSVGEVLQPTATTTTATSPDAIHVDATRGNRRTSKRDREAILPPRLIH
jgi:hypothetical protein